MRSERAGFLLALAAMAVVAVVDAAIGSRAVFLELLLAGPLIAAARASVVQTAIVAALAAATAILLGFASDSFGGAEHVVAAAAVVVGGALSVVIARLREDRERDASRLAVQYGVASALSDAETMEEAAPRLLEAIARPLGFDLGQFWTMDGDELRCTASWHEAGPGLSEFAAASRELAMAPGLGLPGEVWHTRRPVWLGDALQSGNFIRAQHAERAGLRSGMAFAVKSRDEPIGVIELLASGLGERDPELYALADALGIQIGEFLEGLQKAEAVRASEARKGAVLASSLDAVITMDHRGRVVEFNRAAEQLFGYSEERVIGAEMAELIIPPALRENHRKGLRRFVETGTGKIVGRRVELTGMRSDGSEFPVELAVNHIAGSEPPIFTGTVRDITERLSAEREREQLLVLEQTARADAIQARDQLEAILRGIADAVTAQAPDGRLLFANDAAVETLGFESRDALLEAPLADVLGRFDVLDEDANAFPLENLPGRRALAGEDGAEAVVRFRIRDTGEERWSAVKATPIRDGDGRVTMAINVIEDITAHKRAELSQRFLAQSGDVLASSLNPDELLKQVANLVVPEVADWCAIDLATEGGRLERVVLAHADPEMVRWAEQLSERYPADPNAPAGAYQVLRTGRSELYEEIPDAMLRASAQDDEHYRLLREVGLRSGIIAPMIARGRTLGVISIVAGTSGRRFDEQDLELAEEIARRCAIAVDNARLYTERSYIARTLQQSLLPADLPDIPGVEVAARFRPTGEGNEVGGDFYDIFETGGRGWAVVMGDVCGKGPDAAAVTALARYTLRAAAMRERLPSRSLGMLNEALLRQRDDRRFCTVAYAYIEKLEEGARVGLATGGHPLPYVLRAGGTVEAVGKPGTLLGIVPDPDLEDRAVSLAAGDALVFYTDGVIETRSDANGALDEERLADLIAECAGRDADAIAAQVESAAVRSQGGRPRDDIAVVVLRIAN